MTAAIGSPAPSFELRDTDKNDGDTNGELVVKNPPRPLIADLDQAMS